MSLLYFVFGGLFGHFMVKSFENGVFWGLGAVALFALFVVSAVLGWAYACSIIIGIVLAGLIREYIFP